MDWTVATNNEKPSGSKPKDETEIMDTQPFETKTLEQEAPQFLPCRTDTLDASVSKREFDVFIEQIAQIKKLSSDIEITDEETNKQAIDIGIAAKNVVKEIETLRKSIVKEPNDFVKKVNSVAKLFTTDLGAVEQKIKKKIGTYQTKQARIRQEQERKEREEREALQKKLDDAAEKTGTPAIQVPEQAITPAKQITRTESGSVSSRKKWTFEVLNENEVPKEFLMIDEKKIRQAVKNGIRAIPGIRIFEDQTVVLRG